MAQRPKTPQEIDAMRTGGKILATIFRDLTSYVQPGMKERDVNDWVAGEITRHGATATYLEPVPDFPGVICISTNDQIVHSVPSEYVFEIGDVVSFDMVLTYESMKVDSAFTMVIGEDLRGSKKHLLSVTERSLYAGIDAITGEGTHTGDIGAAVEKVLAAGKLGIIKELVGHGVGHEMHMEPEVPNYGHARTGVVLREGDTIAIEPMATLGSPAIITESDGWTISSRDGSLAAHFEHTVLVTKNGAEILTILG